MKSTQLVKKRFKVFTLTTICVMFSQTEAATTFYVNTSSNCATADGSTTKPFCTIQAGVNAATSSDTVQVAAGVYHESVNINSKSLKLLGINPESTVIEGSNVVVYAIKESSTSTQEVEIANFTITGGADAGIKIEGIGSPGAGGYVHNCVLTNNRYGIHIINASALVLNNVMAYSNTGAVVIFGSITLSSNIILNNAFGAMPQSSDCTVLSSFNTYFNNSNEDCLTCSSISDQIDVDPMFVDPTIDDYHVQAGSSTIDAGIPGASYLDPDGSRNDQGAYGGPGAMWPFAANRPVVTTLSLSPSNVTAGSTFNIQATGQVTTP